MNKISTKIIIIIFCAITSIFATAQIPGTPYIVPASNLIKPVVCTESNTQGTDFWVCFGSNYGGAAANTVYLALNIAAETATVVTLSFTQTGNVVNYSIPANSVIRIDLSNVAGGDRRSNVYMGTTSIPSSAQTLHITSDNPVSVYAFNTYSATTDATIVLPVSAWGKEYYRLSYTTIPLSMASGFYDVDMIIANQDGTIVTTPNGTVTLSAGRAWYFVRQGNDMTGNHITSNYPIAYFEHNTGVQIPLGRNYVDILFEQMMPVERWGTKFLVPNAPEGMNTMTNRIRIIASENNTSVNFSGASVVTTDAQTPAQLIPGQKTPFLGTLNAGEWIELQINNTTGTTPVSGDCYIEASNPIGVAAYMLGSNSDGSQYNGDPSIAWIPPLNQSIQSALISPFMFAQGSYTYTQFGLAQSTHYMIIIAPTETKEQTTVYNGTTTYVLNGISALPAPNIPTSWVNNAASEYSYFKWTFTNPNDLNRSFKVSNPDGVIVLAGGTSMDESYYYNAGSGTCIVNP